VRIAVVKYISLTVAVHKLAFEIKVYFFSLMPIRIIFRVKIAAQLPSKAADLLGL
jgi:hypothetical protein